MVKIFYDGRFEILHSRVFQIIEIQKFSSTMVKIFCDERFEILHSGAFQIIEIQKFSSTMVYLVINMLKSFILEHLSWKSKILINHGEDIL